MDLDDSSSPDEREFPGLYEGKKGIEENETASENLQAKKSKDKKEKKEGKAKFYEALGESEEESADTKLFRSPSKSKKSKTFKFPSTKKEKREKSREPDSKDATDGVKEKKIDLKVDKKKVKKEKDKKTKSHSLTSSEAFELGGKHSESINDRSNVYKTQLRYSTDLRSLAGSCS